MKILNLYAGIGGNRYKWGDEHEITAVEWDDELAKLYQERFPNDKVIVADAHQYLLDHYKEFDFIWSSPPCPTHSRARFWNSKSINTKTKPCYFDLKLYQEIIFLKNYYDGKYCVENVIPYYEPLIAAQKRNRHLYWCNFLLPKELSKRYFPVCQGIDEVSKLSEFHQYDLRKYKGKQRIDKIGRNMVDYEAGKTILNTVIGIKQKENINQTELF
jgi:DNA (cytosine-5)-methyltransferase 1